MVDRAAVVLGFLLAPITTAAAGKEFDLLVAGLVGGTVAYLIGRLRAAR